MLFLVFTIKSVSAMHSNASVHFYDGNTTSQLDLQCTLLPVWFVNQAAQGYPTWARWYHVLNYFEMLEANSLHRLKLDEFSELEIQNMNKSKVKLELQGLFWLGKQQKHAVSDSLRLILSKWYTFAKWKAKIIREQLVPGPPWNTYEYTDFLVLRL